MVNRFAALRDFTNQFLKENPDSSSEFKGFIKDIRENFLFEEFNEEKKGLEEVEDDISHEEFFNFIKKIAEEKSQDELVKKYVDQVNTFIITEPNFKITKALLHAFNKINFDSDKGIALIQFQVWDLFNATTFKLIKNINQDIQSLMYFIVALDPLPIDENVANKLLQSDLEKAMKYVNALEEVLMKNPKVQDQFRELKEDEFKEKIKTMVKDILKIIFKTPNIELQNGLTIIHHFFVTNIFSKLSEIEKFVTHFIPYANIYLYLLLYQKPEESIGFLHNILIQDQVDSPEAIAQQFIDRILADETEELKHVRERVEELIKKIGRANTERVFVNLLSDPGCSLHSFDQILQLANILENRMQNVILQFAKHPRFSACINFLLNAIQANPDLAENKRDFEYILSNTNFFISFGLEEFDEHSSKILNIFLKNKKIPTQEIADFLGDLAIRRDEYFTAEKLEILTDYFPELFRIYLRLQKEKDLDYQQIVGIIKICLNHVDEKAPAEIERLFLNLLKIDAFFPSSMIGLINANMNKLNSDMMDAIDYVVSASRNMSDKNRAYEVLKILLDNDSSHPVSFVEGLCQLVSIDRLEPRLVNVLNQPDASTIANAFVILHHNNPELLKREDCISLLINAKEHAVTVAQLLVTKNKHKNNRVIDALNNLMEHDLFRQPYLNLFRQDLEESTTIVNALVEIQRRSFDLLGNPKVHELLVRAGNEAALMGGVINHLYETLDKQQEFPQVLEILFNSRLTLKDNQSLVIKARHFAEIFEIFKKKKIPIDDFILNNTELWTSNNILGALIDLKKNRLFNEQTFSMLFRTNNTPEEISDKVKILKILSMNKFKYCITEKTLETVYFDPLLDLTYLFVRNDKLDENLSKIVDLCTMRSPYLSMSLYAPERAHIGEYVKAFQDLFRIKKDKVTQEDVEAVCNSSDPSPAVSEIAKEFYSFKPPS